MNNKLIFALVGTVAVGIGGYMYYRNQSDGASLLGGSPSNGSPSGGSGGSLWDSAKRAFNVILPGSTSTRDSGRITAKGVFDAVTNPDTNKSILTDQGGINLSPSSVKGSISNALDPNVNSLAILFGDAKSGFNIVKDKYFSKKDTSTMPSLVFGSPVLSAVNTPMSERGDFSSKVVSGDTWYQKLWQAQLLQNTEQAAVSDSVSRVPDKYLAVGVSKPTSENSILRIDNPQAYGAVNPNSSFSLKPSGESGLFQHWSMPFFSDSKVGLN